MSERCADPSANVLLMMANSKDYFEKLLDVQKNYFDTLIREAIDSSRRERLAEITRTNANRAGDIANVALANDRAIKQAELLNTQLMDTAETMRKSMEATAKTIADQFAKMTDEQNARLGALERINNEASGAKAVAPDWSIIVGQLKDAANVQKGRQTISTPILLLIVAAILSPFLAKIVELF